MGFYSTMLVFGCCFLAVSFASAAAAASARLMMTNSENDPIFELDSASLNNLFSQEDFNAVAWINEQEFQRFFVRSPLGYAGFLIELKNSKNAKKLLVRGAPKCEKFLLSVFAGQNTILSKKAFDRISEQIEKKPAVSASMIVPEQARRMIQSNIYIRGPDNVTQFTPDKWNRDMTTLYNNNCYNYGNDIRTDTFAQPGRGTGKKWEANTCDDVWDAALRDGLIPYSRTRAPAWDEKPEKGHFIALVMWPGVNFHWYKKDISGYWSHKPGSTAARNTDNSGRSIQDPATCDRGVYEQFCGYLISVPSVMEIN